MNTSVPPSPSPDEGTTPEDVVAHATRLHRLARRLVRDAANAEDLVQDTWAAALENAPRRDRPLFPWLAQVLRNFAQMGARRLRVRAERAHDVAATADLLPAPVPPDLLYERLEAKRTLMEELARLPEPFRSTLMLRYFEDLTAARIARIQGVPAGTVRWRLKRGIDLLRANLDARGGGRQAWVRAFAPLALGHTKSGKGSSGDALPALGGAIIMSTKAKVAGLAVLVLVVASLFLVSFLPHDDQARATHRDSKTRDHQRLPYAPPLLTSPSAAPTATSALEVVVVDENARALAGATVTLARGLPPVASAGSDAPRPIAAAQTDTQGGSLFPGLVEGNYAVTAMHPSRAPALADGILLVRDQTRSVRLVLSQGGHHLTGRVLETGSGPVPGAQVTAALTERDGEPGAAIPFWATAAGEDGAYALTLAPGRYALRAEADGYAIAMNHVIVEADVTRDLRLDPAAEATGTVVDRVSGRPVEGATVQARHVEGWSSGRSRAVHTDGAGAFRLDRLGAGDYIIEAGRDGRIGRTGRVRLLPGVSRRDLSIALDPGLSISGRVLGADGAGVTGAHVTASIHVGGPPVDTTTGTNGQFLFEGLLAGHYGIIAVAKNGARAQRWTEVGADVTSFDLRLESPVSLEGVVVDAAGTPVAGARVLAATEPGAGWIARTTPSVTTGPDGRFRFPTLDRGKVELRAEKNDAGTAAWGPEKLHAGEEKDIVMRLSQGASLGGVVRYTDGAPAAGAVVYAEYSSQLSRFLTGSDRDRASHRAVAGADGRYALRGLPAGAPRVAASRAGGALPTRPDVVPTPLAQGEHKELDLTVPPSRAITGRVLLPGGRPAVGALVTAEVGIHKPLTAAPLKAITNSDGAFTLEETDLGQTYSLWAELNNYAEARATDVMAGAENVRLVLAAEASIGGVAVDESGRPVVNFELQLGVDGAPRRLWRPGGDIVETVHDPAGAFEVRSLAPGTYNLQVRTLARKTGLATITLVPGEHKRGLRITLAGPVSVRGRVVDHETGAPIAGIKVHVGGGNIDLPYGGGGPPGPTTDAAGAFQVDDVWLHNSLLLQLNDPGRSFINEVERVPVGDVARALDLGSFRLVARGKRESLGDIGIAHQTREGFALVTEVPAGRPAARAGLRVGERLLAIDGRDVRGLLKDGRKALLAGKVGTTVTLLIQGSDGARRTVAIMRDAQ